MKTGKTYTTQTLENFSIRIEVSKSPLMTNSKSYKIGQKSDGMFFVSSQTHDFDYALRSIEDAIEFCKGVFIPKY